MSNEETKVEQESVANVGEAAESETLESSEVSLDAKTAGTEKLGSENVEQGEMEQLSSSEESSAEEVSQDNTTQIEAVAEMTAGSESSEDQSSVVHYEDDELKPLIVSLLFAYGDPLSSKRLSEIAKVDEAIVDDILLELLEESKSPASGIELVRIAEKYQYRTKARFAPAIRELKAGKPKRLSGAALETLAVIAYRQPVVKSDIEKIRGVDVAPTLKTLLERSLVKIIGHQPTVGQPALYGTTDEFLKIFSLNSLSELPSLRDVADFSFEPGEGDDGNAPEEAQVVAQ